MAVRQKAKSAPITVELDWESTRGPIHLVVRASLDDWKKLLSVRRLVKSGSWQGAAGNRDAAQADG